MPTGPTTAARAVAGPLGIEIGVTAVPRIVEVPPVAVGIGAIAPRDHCAVDLDSEGTLLRRHRIPVDRSTAGGVSGRSGGENAQSDNALECKHLHVAHDILIKFIVVKSWLICRSGYPIVVRFQ
jgi:hypothetical protein